MKTFRHLLLCMFVLFFLNSCYTVRKTDQFFGIETSTNNTVYVIDISGSMAGIDEGSIEDQVKREVGQQAGNKVSDVIGGKVGSILGKKVAEETTKLGEATRKLIPAIKGLPDDKLFAIYAYNNDVEQHTNGLTAANNTTRTVASVFVEQLKAGGGTDTKEALLEALATQDVTEIVLMSDGLPNGGPARVLSAVETANTNKVIIHTIAFGKDADEDFMRTLAEDNGGTYVKN